MLKNFIFKIRDKKMPLDSSRKAIFKTADLKNNSTFRTELFNEAKICLIF